MTEKTEAEYVEILAEIKHKLKRSIWDISSWIPYAQLSENQKEINRDWARYKLKSIREKILKRHKRENGR